MKSESIFWLWPITPFGATSAVTDPNPVTTGQQQNPPAVTNPPANQGNSGQQPPAADPKDGDDDPYAGLTPKELKRLLADIEKSKTATESEKTALQTKIDEDERKKKTELENAQTDLANEKTTSSKLREALSRQSLINAILQDDRFTWHNIDDVVAKLGDSVKVSDDGKVDGLTRSLTSVAKDNEYLVKSRKDGQQQQQPPTTTNGQPTGFQPGQGGANQGGSVPPNANDLVKKYPALGARMGGSAFQPAVPQPAVPQHY